MSQSPKGRKAREKESMNTTHRRHKADKPRRLQSPHDHDHTELNSGSSLVNHLHTDKVRLLADPGCRKLGFKGTRKVRSEDPPFPPHPRRLAGDTRRGSFLLGVDPLNPTTES